jgi:hypothetical protein
LKAKANESFSMHAKVWEIIFRYRATPLSNNKTPAEMYPQRNIGIQLDAIRPMKHVQNTDHAVRSRQLSVGRGCKLDATSKTKQYGSWVKLSKNLGNSTTK